MSPQERAGVVLDFIVVGAGLSGLATAFCLQRAGHRVLVIEKSDGKERSSGSLPSSPNMTRLVQAWGVADKLDKMATHFNRIHFFEADTGSFLGAFNEALFDEVKRDALHGYVIFPHGQLLELVYQLALKEGVQFRFNETVVGLEPGEACVSLESGEMLRADIIVGADGYHSIVRQYVADGEDELESNNKVVQLRTTIPLAKVRQHQDLSEIGDPSDWDWWLGDGYLCHCSVTNQNRDYTLVIFYPYHGVSTKENKEWHTARELGSYGVAFEKMEPRLRRLIQLADSFAARIYESPAAMENLVCPSSKVLLVGEAAHHVMPSVYHLTAMGFEDAETLGCLFSRIQRKDQIARITTAYDEIRQPRSEFVHHYEKQYQGTLCVPEGPVRNMRDESIKRLTTFTAGDPDDEEMILQMWGGELQMMTHDATDKVEDWWGQYGASIGRSTAQRSPLPAQRKETKFQGFKRFFKS